MRSKDFCSRSSSARSRTATAAGQASRTGLIHTTSRKTTKGYIVVFSNFKMSVCFDAWDTLLFVNWSGEAGLLFHRVCPLSRRQYGIHASRGGAGNKVVWKIYSFPLSCYFAFSLGLKSHSTKARRSISCWAEQKTQAMLPSFSRKKRGKKLFLPLLFHPSSSIQQINAKKLSASALVLLSSFYVHISADFPFLRTEGRFATSWAATRTNPRPPSTVMCVLCFSPQWRSVVIGAAGASVAIALILATAAAREQIETEIQVEKIRRTKHMP